MMTYGTMVPHSIFSAGRFLTPLKNAQAGTFFCPPPVFSVFIDLRRNIFRDCVEEDASDAVIIDINLDVSWHEGDSGKKRLKYDNFNCLLPKNCLYVFFFFWGGKRTGYY